MSEPNQPPEFRPAGTLDLSTALAEYRGPWTSRLAAHLLRRAGFGAPPLQIGVAAAAGMQSSVARLLHGGPDRMADVPDGDISYQNGPGADKTQRRNAIMRTQLWWL